MCVYLGEIIKKNPKPNRRPNSEIHSRIFLTERRRRRKKNLWIINFTCLCEFYFKFYYKNVCSSHSLQQWGKIGIWKHISKRALILWSYFLLMPEFSCFICIIYTISCGWFRYNISLRNEVEVKMIFIRVFYYTRELSICVGKLLRQIYSRKYVFYHIVMDTGEWGMYGTDSNFISFYFSFVSESNYIYVRLSF